MEIDGCSNGATKLPLNLNWSHLLPPSDNDCPPDIIITSNKKQKEIPKQESQSEDLEMVLKSDRDIEEAITRFKRGLNDPGLVAKLRDGGEKLRANLKRHEEERDRRLERKMAKEVENNECEEMIQVSDSDDGVSRGKNQGDRKSLSSPSFSKIFNKKLDNAEDAKDSRTVNAFEEDLFYMKPCNGKTGNPKNQVAGKGRSKLAVSSSSKENSRSSKYCLVASEKKMASNDDKSTPEFSVPNSPQGPPSSNLRPRRPKRYYNEVEEDPPVQTTAQFLEKLDPCVKDVTLCYPSRDDPDAVGVSHTDMACLAPETYLSSNIMNFYIRYLQQPTSSSECTTNKYHFFNTYFYNKLEKLNEEDSFPKFRKWWKGVSLFEKAYILLPVHESAHWSLVIICFATKEDEQGPILLHLDSLELHNSKVIFDKIKRFLKEEWSYLRRSGTRLDLPFSDEIWDNLKCIRVAVPLQKNEYDCGLFVLFYMERFIKEAPERIKKKDLSKFGRQWFRPREASNLRSVICRILVEEFKKVKEKQSPSSLVLD